MESIKQFMIDIQKDKNEDEKISWCRCETCHIWQKEINTLQSKLDKALQPNIPFAIDPSKFKRFLNPSYKKYKHVQKDSNRKSTSHHNLSCHYFYYKKGHTIENCKFKRLFVPKGVFQWLPKCNLDLTHSQGPNENWVPITLV